MAVREFNTVGHYVQWGIGTGGLATVAQGAFTVIAVAKLLNTTNDGAVVDLSNAGTSRATYGHDTANQRYLRGSFQDAGGGPTWGTGDGWVLVAWTKSSGTTTVRYHKCVMSSDTWTHQNSSSSVDNDDNTCTFASTRINNDNDFVFRGRIAAVAVYNTVLNDATIEGLRSSFADWLSTSGVIAAWRFDQAATSSPIDDQTAGGANQTTLVGSTVVTGDDPPSFSFGAAAEAGSTAAPWRGPAPGLLGPTAEPRPWVGVASATTPPITGTLSATEEDDTSAASGTSVQTTGTVAATEADDTLSASGTHTPPVFTGTVAVTEQDDSLAASGSHTPPEFTGTVAATEAADTLSGSGSHTPPAFTGAISVSESGDTLASSGIATPPSFTGTLAVTESSDILTAAGTFTSPPITGTLALTEGGDTLAAAGVNGVIAPTAAERTYVVPTESRVLQVPAEDRAFQVPADGRVYVVR